MGKRLIIAEKPSVGRDIANVLNCREKSTGYLSGDNDIVTWAVGHLVGLCSPDEMDAKYTDWKLEDLPIFPNPFFLKVLDSGAKQFEIIKSLMNDSTVDRIVCATDAGREGELIFRYIYQMAGCKKPVERLWISSLTYRAIKEGFENLKPDSAYDNLYKSARCRSEADWLIGMNGSRAYAITNQMRRLSVGRVLSPTLSILVKRELERRNFVPEEYCEVVAEFYGYEGKLLNEDKENTDEWSHFSIDQKEDLELFVKNRSSIGRICCVECTEEVQPPQQLYDLTSLQRDANRLYGMSSKWTLDTAQSLYEKHKAITYPRTDSRYLSADIKSTLTKRLEGLLTGEIDDYVAQAMQSDKNLYGRFINTKGVSDHHAIIPTGEAKGMNSWSDAEKRIYDLIARRFIGMFFPDRKVLRQKIKTDVGGNIFLSIGECVVEPGWADVDFSRNIQVQELPAFDEGDRVGIAKMRLRTDKTKAPAPHTETSLLAAMEHAGSIVPEDSVDDKETEFGIGTPATRAATIEKLIEKEMAVRKGRMLIPTEYGIALTNILPEFLQSPMMTGEWEAKLARISKGEESTVEFMTGIRDLTKEVVAYAVKQGNQNLNLANSVGTCPICNSPVLENSRAYYCKNRSCNFNGIFKAVKGAHPTLHSSTMRELLMNRVAVTDKGTFTLNKDKYPYVFFAYAPKIAPDYDKLHELFEEYGLEPVDKVANGGGLWVAGSKNDDLMKDFVRDCKKIGCEFAFADEAKALHYKEGWYHRVDPEFSDAYKRSLKKKTATKPQALPVKQDEDDKDPVLEMIRKSGFSYVDKRPNGGSLWIIAGEKEGKKLIDQCKKLGFSFTFTASGGRASKHKPAWYTK